MKVGAIAVSAMSEEQLSAFFEAVKTDAGLQEKLKGVADLDAAVAIAKEAGFDVSKADWLKHQTQQTTELSDEQLAGAAGGGAIDEMMQSRMEEMMRETIESLKGRR